MKENLGFSKKEQSFLKKWSVIRKKGKLRYIIIRGLIHGLSIFSVWFIVTLIEVQMSEYKQALYTPEYLMKRSMTWLITYVLIGLVIAQGSWKAKEDKFRYLS